MADAFALAIDSGKNIFYICVFANKAQTVRCIGINSFEEKVIDKSHKKRYILFINALKKSVHRFCHPESRGLLKTRYGPAVCCHFGAGAVS